MISTRHGTYPIRDYCRSAFANIFVLQNIELCLSPPEADSGTTCTLGREDDVSTENDDVHVGFLVVLHFPIALAYSFFYRVLKR